MIYNELSDDAKALVHLQGLDIFEDLDIFTEQGTLKEEISKKVEMIVRVTGCSLSHAIIFTCKLDRAIVIYDDIFSKITEDIPIVKHNQVSTEARRQWRKGNKK